MSEPKTILLPNRTTRGNRYKHVIRDEDIEEEQEDKEFWQQEFFQEEEKDEQYNTESDVSDIFESDFLDTEDEDDEEQGGGDDDDRPRKKKLKPPGYKQRAAVLKRKRAAQDEATPRPKPPPPPSASQQELDARYEAPSLRHSTRVKVAEAKEERRKRDTTTPKRRPIKRPALKILTQEELLAEAAATEIENTRSLQILEAVEEESKRLATVHRVRVEGPRVRYLSRALEGELVTTLQAVDCDPLQLSQLYEFSAHPAPPEPRPPTCFVTGRPAAYRDPRSGLPYSDAAALVELRRRIVANVPAQARVITPVPGP